MSIAETFSSDISQALAGGMTCEHSSQRQLMSSLVVSHAKTFRKLADVPGLMVSEADYGRSSTESFAQFDQDSLSWKTLQGCLFGGSIEFSGTWPRSGTMRNGNVFQRSPLVPHTSGIEFGLQRIPTPTVGDSKNSRNATANRKPGSKHNSGMTLCDYVTIYPTPRTAATDNAGGSNSRRTAKAAGVFIGRKLNPEFSEWLMGFPIGWTALEDAETQ